MCGQKYSRSSLRMYWYGVAIPLPTSYVWDCLRTYMSELWWYVVSKPHCTLMRHPSEVKWIRWSQSEIMNGILGNLWIIIHATYITYCTAYRLGIPPTTGDLLDIPPLLAVNGCKKAPARTIAAPAPPPQASPWQPAQKTPWHLQKTPSRSQKAPSTVAKNTLPTKQKPPAPTHAKKKTFLSHSCKKNTGFTRLQKTRSPDGGGERERESW